MQQLTKYLLATILVLAIFSTTRGQGVSFSYLFPKNGYLSAPVSPFSIRGIGIGGFFGAETGATLYNVPGLAMDELPFSYDKPLTGPHFALMVPAELFIRLPLGPIAIKLMGGGFGWWNLNTRINTGNMDRAFRAYENWDVLNGDYTLDDQLGGGWMAGMELEVAVNDKFSIFTEVQYLKGGAKSSLSGTYSGGRSGEPITTQTLDLPDPRIVVEGVEVSIGVQMSAN